MLYHQIQPVLREKILKEKGMDDLHIVSLLCYVEENLKILV